MKKFLGLLAIIIGLVIIAVLVYFMFFFKLSPSEMQDAITGTVETPGQIEEQNTPSQPAIINNQPQVSFSNREVGEEDLKMIAASFAERFGSFSNQSDYTNIRDLKLFMSESMRRWADQFIEDELFKNINTTIYYGISTKAVAEETDEFNDSSGYAKILVKTQRRESTGTTNNDTNFQQDILINFVKEKGAWKVDSAYWQDR